MPHFRKPVLLRIVASISVVLACISLAFGSNVSVLLSSRVIAEVPVVDWDSFSQHSANPEEAPQESPSPEEQTEEIEAPSFSLRRKSQKAVRILVHPANVDDVVVSKLRPPRAVCTLNPTLVPQFEHFYRNGCGAHLRC